MNIDDPKLKEKVNSVIEQTSEEFVNRLKEKYKDVKLNERNYNEYEQEKLKEHNNRIKSVLDKMMDVKYIDVDIKDFIVTDENKYTFEKVIDWLDNYVNGKWLVLKGSQGTGKTFLKNIIIKELYTRYHIRSYSTTHYTLFTEYLDSMQIGKNKILLEKLGKTKMLIIDEIGRRKQTEAFSDFMFEILDRIYLNKGSVLLITNKDTVTEYVDLSRLNECGVSLILKGKDWRSK